MQPSRSGTVEGRPIAVFDDLLPLEQIRQLFSVLTRSGFTKDEAARSDTSQFTHWAANVDQPEVLPIFKPTIEAARWFGQTSGRAYRVYRSYCNYAGFGDVLFTHTDCLPDQHELTGLWFIAPEWDVEWGGETLFFNEDKDAEFVVSPRPGRLVLFDGAILHAGRPPSRICHMPRYTFAFKLEPYQPSR
ncbi:2OG-Fe(II) oxygenase [Gammaproteobacteria bacterium AB-CW1]|uniref:2OG-Fe(II) oxygenase n=1 Tax=Natronospira elongata TaxID=3110268 RepID=A0AAP6JI33_9GAMM|nr:2OG-Fe(II) oxygenase [Gammaproteobacteria bacterium AB-CW1]